MIRRLTLATLIALSLTATLAALPWSKKYPLTVVYGAGSGTYKAGDIIPISAWPPQTLLLPEVTPATVFSHWTGGAVADPAKAETTITMPAHALEIRATYFTP